MPLLNLTRVNEVVGAPRNRLTTPRNIYEGEVTAFNLAMGCSSYSDGSESIFGLMN